MAARLFHVPSEDDGWSFPTIKEYFEGILKESDKRHEGLMRESDRRYQERHDAAQLALQTTTTAAEKAVTTAMTAAEKAAAKAELSADERFKAIDELKRSLDAYQHESLPRLEGEKLIGALADKITALATLVNTIASERQGASQLGAGITPYLLNFATIAVVIFLHYAK